MSKSNSIVLDEKKIYEVKDLASETRRFFGVYSNVPIANDIKLLLEKKVSYYANILFQIRMEHIPMEILLALRQIKRRSHLLV